MACSVLGAAAGNLANFALGAMLGTRRDPDVQFCYTVEIDGITLGIVNLSGNLYIRAGHPAFREIDSALAAVTWP